MRYSLTMNARQPGIWLRVLKYLRDRNLEVDDDTYKDPQNPANKQASNRLRRQVQPVTNLQAKNRPKRPKRVRPTHDPHKTRALKLRLAKRLKNNHPCPVKNGYGKHETQSQNKRATHSQLK